MHSIELSGIPSGFYLASKVVFPGHVTTGHISNTTPQYIFLDTTKSQFGTSVIEPSPCAVYTEAETSDVPLPNCEFSLLM